jgi:hypothetical protein
MPWSGIWATSLGDCKSDLPSSPRYLSPRYATLVPSPLDGTCGKAEWRMPSNQCVDFEIIRSWPLETCIMLGSNGRQRKRYLWFIAESESTTDREINGDKSMWKRFTELFTIPRNRRATMAASTLHIGQNLCGINSMSAGSHQT